MTTADLETDRIVEIVEDFEAAGEAMIGRSAVQAGAGLETDTN
jgi:hypothetical protein